MIIIVLEGVNGSGKTTVGSRLATALGSIGTVARLVDPTSSTPHHAALRRLALDDSNAHGADSDAVLMAGLRVSGMMAMRSDMSNTQVDVAIIERWSLAIEAYGTVDGARPDLLCALAQTLDAVIGTTCTLLLDVRADTAQKRLNALGELNRFETRGLSYLDHLAAAHRRFAERRNATALVDASGPKDDVMNRVISALAVCGGSRLAELAERLTASPPR